MPPGCCAVVANELKYKAPKAHTMLELVYVRWGPVAHIIYFFFAVLTNLLVSLSMLQGIVLALLSHLGSSHSSFTATTTETSEGCSGICLNT